MQLYRKTRNSFLQSIDLCQHSDKKYFIFYKSEKIKSYNSLFCTEYDLKSYKEKYEQYRKELTYYLFNYLEDGVQNKVSNKSPLYSMIYYEYCKKYDSGIPFVLNSLYEIVQKFICFFPLFKEEMIKTKSYLKDKIMNSINEKIDECQKLEYYFYIKEEIDDVLNYTLKRIELLFSVEPEDKVSIMEFHLIQASFEEMIEGILEGYKQFSLKKDF